jgi:hypothetical protein
VLVRRRSVAAGLKRLPVLLLGCCLVAYVGGLLYCGKYTVISIEDPRMFYPALPLLLLLVGAAFPRPASAPAPGRRRILLAGLLLLACAAYPLAQVGSALQNTLESAEDDVAEGAARPLAAAESLGQWLDRHVGPDEVVIANDGQAFGYHFDRKTIGLATLAYSSERWTEERLRRVADTFGARFLVLSLESGDYPILAEESPFLRELGEARELPAWVTPLARNGSCRVYRLSVRSRTAPPGPR